MTKNSDYTTAVEQDILREHAPRFQFLWRLFLYVFSSAKVMCGIFLGLSLLISFMQPVIALIWRNYIDNAGAATVFENQWQYLIILLVLYLTLGYIREILVRCIYGNNFIDMLLIVQFHRLQEKFQLRLNKKVTSLHPEYLEVPKVNDIISRSYDAIGGFQSRLQYGVVVQGYAVIALAFGVIAAAAALYIFSPLLVLIVLVAPVPVLYTTYVHNKLSFKFARDNAPILRQAGYYQNILLGRSMKEVKANNLFDFFYTKWKVLIDDYNVRERRNRLLMFILDTANSMISTVVIVVMQVYAIVLLSQGEISLGELGAVMVLGTSLMQQSNKLFSSLSTLLSCKNESAQFFEFIDMKEYDEQSKSTTGSAPSLVSVSNLSYRYPLTDEYRLEGVSLDIREGERVAFVGENGAGKSTMIKLITGMLEPSCGKVVVQNRTQGEANQRYDALTCVFQESNKYETFTIAENVWIGDVMRERDDVKIEEALDFVAINEVDKDMLLGKDIGGTDLSGGQWQKLSIARAYYRGRDFYILDEPTSNLDPLVETEIFMKYLKMAQGKTVIIVTHRINMAAKADRIVVFKDGKIVEDGAHTDLLALGGEYARLYHTQAQWYER